MNLTSSKSDKIIVMTTNRINIQEFVDLWVVVLSSLIHLRITKSVECTKSVFSIEILLH